ncbi:MAG: DUF1858 domain-containing protein [Clostridia bacterium]|nr:DUF1858 domain-containing protein [Clostridia bacterium]MBO4886046.1 DUF1858 domain-containing protein [Clostridia bacterium]
MATVNKEMTIGEVLNIDRRTAPIFLGFGMHCLGCPVSTGESIQDAAAVHGVDAEKLVEELNKFLAEEAK